MAVTTVSVPLFDSRTPLAPLRSAIDAKLAEVIEGARFILGPEVAAFEADFAAYVGAQHAIGVANGTDAITLALRAMGVGPGDEVVVRRPGGPARWARPRRSRSSRPRTSALSATAARSRPATRASPSGCGCCASTARATSRRSS
jgi:hypothetical protein